MESTTVDYRENTDNCHSSNKHWNVILSCYCLASPDISYFRLTVLIALQIILVDFGADRKVRTSMHKYLLGVSCTKCPVSPSRPSSYATTIPTDSCHGIYMHVSIFEMWMKSQHAHKIQMMFPEVKSLCDKWGVNSHFDPKSFYHKPHQKYSSKAWLSVACKRSYLLTETSRHADFYTMQLIHSIENKNWYSRKK